MKFLSLVNVQKFQKYIFKFLTAIKFNKFQLKSIKFLKYPSIGVWWCLSCIGDQHDITTSLMTMKTTTKICENQKSVENGEKKISKPFKPLGFLW